MKIAAFIDGPNTYAALKSIDMDLDYQKLLSWLKSQGVLVHASYYTAMPEGDDHNPMQKLVDWIAYNGYLLVTKPTTEYINARGDRKIKGNMDVELTVDMLEMADHVDQVYLFSGDGDFRRLVEAIQRKGVRVTVVSSKLGDSVVMSDELRRQADEFIDFDTLRNIVSRDKQKDTVLRLATASA